jgi:hypothetical protein
MLASKTTLIVGAGASMALDYPSGAELREWVIEGKGILYKEFEALDYDRGVHSRLAWRFRDSMIPSIDAFLAEPENADLRDWGVLCIAAALLPCEALHPKNPPAWLKIVFNAIRAAPTPDRHQQLTIVTFNYDLSIEHFLFRAFAGAYKLPPDLAKVRLNQAVKIIHVYGDLGPLNMWGGDRVYAGEIYRSTITTAANNLKIIGREPDDPRFVAAQEAISGAEFIAILGFGYDETNIANLKLPEVTAEKHLFSTGWNMGVGMRAWIDRLGINDIMFGLPNHGVAEFLDQSAFFQWANTPGARGHQLRQGILSTSGQSMRLPPH